MFFSAMHIDYVDIAERNSFAIVSKLLSLAYLCVIRDWSRDNIKPRDATPAGQNVILQPA